MWNSTFYQIFVSLCYEDSPNRVVDTIWNITTPQGKTILQKVLFHIITHLIFHKSGSSTLTLVGVLICFIAPPFAYTKMYVRILPLYVGAIEIKTFIF